MGTVAPEIDPVASTTADSLPRAEAFLHALSRSVRQFHTYPAASPHCVEAIADARRALDLIELDSLVCVVGPRELRIGGYAVGRDTAIEQELARRLYESRCETLAIDRLATARELARLCTELAARRKPDEASLDERLRSHGVQRISASAAYQPVLLDVEATGDACAVVEQDRLRQESQPVAGRVAHLYPADKGWVRLDPALPLNHVTLSGLARLVDEPASLAVMLAQLAGDADAGLRSSAEALEQHCEDVARLYTALDPAVARTRFAKLASAVLTLDSQRRRRLLSNTVLPGLIDGRPEGDLLRDFPDVDLAEALSLLLDVEAAAPELLDAALDRLHLSPERQLAVAPLLEQRIRAHGAGKPASLQDTALRERTQQLIQVANGNASFHDFAAFDLCTDEATEAIIARTNDTIRTTNLEDTQLACVAHLLALTVNSEAVEGLLRHATRLLGDLERSHSLVELASRLEALQRTAGALRDSRSTVAAAITDAIEAFFTPARFQRLVSMYEAGGEERATANRLIAAAGASLTSAVVRTLQERSGDKRVLQLVCDHATIFAPALAKVLDQLPVMPRIAAIRALAAAGRGTESSIARQLTNQSETVVREALAALAQIGSEPAAEFVTRHLQRTGGAEAAGGDELLWQFAPAITRQCVRSLLRQRTFVIDNPQMVARLLQRIDRGDASKLGDVLTPLMSLRFRFWNRRLARVGRQAAALLH